MSKEREIFCNAIEIEDLEQRRAYLRKSCRGDKELRRRVSELLEIEGNDSSFLSEEFMATGSQSSSSVNATIGRYKLLEEIGEGGCGIVYMAEQRDPVRRRVALKILKPGMDTRQVVARFEAERQALAMMDHPYIAGVLDGGETDLGRPYFVMELVDGVPITEFCDANRMNPHERLNLFMKVCLAIQHAHQKGLIHRDIKPSNILVTLHSGEPVPRVIDFGISKAIGQDLTEKTLFTGYGQVIGTFQYMSPEQAERSDLDIDTRSDVYSLGVLLYELLTGETPLERSRIKEAAIDEVLRIVREEEPPTPSTRLSKLGDRGSIIGQQRGMELPRLGKLVRGDLDWIVMRALEKDRNRRFESVGEFVADIERHLADEPVLSGPPSALYRGVKFIRRNRLGVFATAAVVGSLMLGLTFAAMGLVRENAAHGIAIENAAEAQTVLTVLRYMVQANKESGRGRDFTLQQMLDEFSNRLLAMENGNLDVASIPKMWMRDYKNLDRDVYQIAFPDLSSMPAVTAEIHAVLGLNYAELDLYEQALTHFQREYDLCRRSYGDEHARVAWAAHQIAKTYRDRANRSRYQEAAKRDQTLGLKYATIAVGIFDRLDSYSQSSMIPRGIYCELLAKAGDPARAEKVLLRTIEKLEATRQELADADGASLFLKRTLVACLVQQGRYEEAIDEGRKNLQDALAYSPGSDRPAEASRAWALIQFGDVYRAAGNEIEASRQYKQAMTLVEDHEPPSFLYCVAGRKHAIELSKQLKLQEAIEIWKRLLVFKNPIDVIEVYQHLVRLSLGQGKSSEAHEYCQEMLALAGEEPSKSDIRTIARFTLAFCHSNCVARPFNPDVCHELCETALPEARKLAEDQHDAFSLFYSWLLLHQHPPPTLDEVEIAIQHSQEALHTLQSDYLISLAHYTLSIAYSMRGDSEASSHLARANAQLAIQNLPEHELFLHAQMSRWLKEL